MKSERGRPPVSIERLTLRVREACDLLGLPRSTFYELLQRGELAHIRIGRGNRGLILVERVEIDRFLARNRVPARYERR